MIVTGGLGLLTWFTLAPKTVEVDAGEVRLGAMEITVDEDGVTRYRDLYKITAPLSGEMRRIDWESGDAVRRGQLLATILPAPSALLDPRTRQEAEGRVQAAEAARQRAQAQFKSAEEELEKAKRYLERDERRIQDGAISAPVLEDSRQAWAMATSASDASRAALAMADYDLRVAQAALRSGTGVDAESGFQLSSPVDGVIINVPEESGRILAAGETILEIGDPQTLEIRADILSQDAVQVRPGQNVRIEQWGGDEVITGTVVRVEPSAFTKVSALGVDEQRVWVTIGLETTETVRGLGHGFRVEARIVIWSKDDALLAPAGAVFRSGKGWAAYRINAGGRAEEIQLDLGKRNPSDVEVLGGAKPGDRLVLHPGDRLDPGSKLRVRP